MIHAFSLDRRQLSTASIAITLGALALTIGSGKLMQEHWPRSGELNHLADNLHLLVLAWLVMVLAVLVHLFGVWQRGGIALASSMLSSRIKRGDRPSDLPGQVQRWLRP